MLRLTPILLAVIYGLVMYRLSVWRTHRELDARSTELADPVLKRMTDRLAAALGESDGDALVTTWTEVRNRVRARFNEVFQEVADSIVCSIGEFISKKHILQVLSEEKLALIVVKQMQDAIMNRY